MIHNTADTRPGAEDPIRDSAKHEGSVGLKNYDSDDFEDEESNCDSKTCVGLQSATEIPQKSSSSISSTSKSER